MTTERKLNRQQAAEYVKGSAKHSKPFVYSVQTTERKGASLAYFAIEGDESETAADAKKSAWRNAKAWVAELGPLETKEREYISRAE